MVETCASRTPPAGQSNASSPPPTRAQRPPSRPRRHPRHALNGPSRVFTETDLKEAEKRLRRLGRTFALRYAAVGPSEWDKPLARPTFGARRPAPSGLPYDRSRPVDCYRQFVEVFETSDEFDRCNSVVPYGEGEDCARVTIGCPCGSGVAIDQGRLKGTGAT